MGGGCLDGEGFGVWGEDEGTEIVEIARLVGKIGGGDWCWFW